MATGAYKIGEADKKFEQRNVTSTFYRLEKKFDGAFPYYDVYEFYKVRNGNMYCRHHENLFIMAKERADTFIKI